MKNILGLDLGSSSIGWAFVREASNENEVSEIVELGVRPVPLTSDEQINFEKGKPYSENAQRTLARSMRRNLQRYKLRREHLRDTLKRAGIINDDTILAETGKNSTYETLELRALAVTDKLELKDFARVLFAINKKRGYKSNRKFKNEDDGSTIDGMEVAKKLYDDGITPGEYVFDLLKRNKKNIPDFYRSDLVDEFNRVWNKQKEYYKEILTDELRESVIGKNKGATWSICKEPFGIVGIKIEGKRDEQRLEKYRLRSASLRERVSLEELAIVLQEINSNISSSSGYLGAISDRSKFLFFNNITVGQFLFNRIKEDRHRPLKNLVFYRQDYLDEFEKIWETQSSYYPDILTPKLKSELRDTIIFYQRKLKSQKNLISICEFEGKEREIVRTDGTKTVKKVGPRVAPRSSPLFQEFKIWQVLGNVEVTDSRVEYKKGDDKSLSEEQKNKLFDYLNIRKKVAGKKALKVLFGNDSKYYKINYENLDGNVTNSQIYETLLSIAEIEGYDANSILSIKSYKENPTIDDSEIGYIELREQLYTIWKSFKLSLDFLSFDAQKEGKELEKQPLYEFWHILYSYEGDDSPSGNETLYRILMDKYGMKKEHAVLFSRISFLPDYGSLSTRAISKIFPYIKDNRYSDACEKAGYRHSKHSLTLEEIESRELKDKLELLPKNSLRQPVVEKILNQMINVINALIDKHSEKDEKGNITKAFKFDEIRVELARELKKNAKEREELSRGIAKAEKLNKEVEEIIRREFGIANPSKNDIIKYRLYDELKDNGYKELYLNTYIPKEKLFTNEIEVEHIIPKARTFDNSLSNKTLTFDQINREKGEKTAFDYVSTKADNVLNEYLGRVQELFKKNIISKSKYRNLLKKEDEIGEGFIERDLRETQYIAKKAKDMLLSISRRVVSTNGSITDRLREDWGLIDIMKEINIPKYEKCGMVETLTRKDGRTFKVIKDWTKRNDHRHHAMDALTVAFTKQSYIQYLNNLNARKDEGNKLHDHILGIQAKETEKIKDEQEHDKRVFKSPMPHFRAEARKHLENILVSLKAKNKVATVGYNILEQHKTKNKNKKSTEKGNKTPQKTLTPRGSLHKETIYGSSLQLMDKPIKLSKKFTIEQADMIANKEVKELVISHMKNYGNLAFDSKTLKKYPIVYREENVTEVLCYERIYTIRKAIDKDLKIDKVIDVRIREILKERVYEFNGNQEKAFANLEENPIWLNKETGISIKRVAISGISTAESLHTKKDHLGCEVLSKSGRPIPNDFVSTGGNHHVAIYVDSDGNYQEYVMTFFEAMTRVNSGLSIINREYNKDKGWTFLFTMKQNEMFVFPNEKEGFYPDEINLLDPANKNVIARNLFRVQKFSSKDYYFRHQYETAIVDENNLKDITWKRITSIGKLKKIVKIRINHLGDIVEVGEY